ncbi:MAG TPA: hypothetical protein VGQ55_01645 [Pyrinomonadaceae bacterium]|jgi:hypothetical protein|nr:hypothetical protein [Pyrinomonadaceae bacterium]
MSEYEWDDNDVPLAYLITFRTYGTWLHGDRRGSVDRHGRNVFGAEMIRLDPMYSSLMQSNMKSEPVLLNGRNVPWSKKQSGTSARTAATLCGR